MDFKSIFKGDYQSYEALIFKAYFGRLFVVVKSGLLKHVFGIERGLCKHILGVY